MKKDPIVPHNLAPGNPAQPKIGAGHASAMFRQGISESRALLYTGSNIAQPPEYGLYGHQTPGEIAADRQPAPTPTLDEEPATSPLQQSMREADAKSRDRAADRPRDRDMNVDR